MLIKTKRKIRREITGYSSQLETLTERISKLPAYVPADEIYKAMRLIGEKKEKVAKELESLVAGDRLGQEVPVDLKDYEEFVKAMYLIFAEIVFCLNTRNQSSKFFISAEAKTKKLCSEKKRIRNFIENL